MAFARYRRALRQNRRAKPAPEPIQWWLIGAVFVAAGLLVTPACRRRPTPPPVTVFALAGTVTQSAGAPLAGASVALTGDPDDGRVPLATVRTSGAGTFRVDRVPAGSYRLRVRALGFVDASVRVQVRGDTHKNSNSNSNSSGSSGTPATIAVSVKMLPTVSLAGRIQDGRGTPIPLARVLAFAVPPRAPSGKVDAPGATDQSATVSDEAAIHETRADEQGGFKVMGLAAGAHRLLIEAPGLGTASAGPVQAPDDDVVVVLPGEIRTIVGRVTRGGQPVRGARVMLGGEAVTETRMVEGDAEGRFVFAGVGPGNYALRAEAGGLVTAVVKEVVMEWAPAPAGTVELALVPGLYARGRVTGEGGRAVVGASVQLDLVPAAGLWPALSTDSDGRWTSGPLAAGTYRIRARREGFVAKQTATVSVPAVTAPDAIALPPVVLELIPTGEIRGRVVDERGAPVAGATIHDRLAVMEDLGVIWARLPLAAEAAAMPAGTILPSSVSSRATSRRATSDATGRFVLGDVPPGRVEVEVLYASSVPLRTAAVKLAPGERLDIGTVRVQSAIPFAGRVVDAEGRPVAGARVAVSSSSSSSSSSSPPSSSGGGGAAATSSGGGISGAGAVGALYAVSGADGGFSLPLPAGEHRLTASALGHGEVTVTVRLPVSPGAAGSPAPTILRLGKGGEELQGILEGAVHDAEGRPLGRARISINAPGAAATSPPLASTLADAGGGFRLTGLPALLGGAVLSVQHQGYAAHRQVIDAAAAGSPLRIVVTLPGGIDGEVHERITGAPVPNFHIEARGPNGAQARFPEGGGGRKAAASGIGALRFSFRRLTPGRWTLRLEARGFRPVEQTIDVASASSPGDASVRDLRLEMERG